MQLLESLTHESPLHRETAGCLFGEIIKRNIVYLLEQRRWMTDSQTAQTEAHVRPLLGLRDRQKFGESGYMTLRSDLHGGGGVRELVTRPSLNCAINKL